MGKFKSYTGQGGSGEIGRKIDTGSAENKLNGSELVVEVVKGILEDFFHGQTENLDRHFNVILREFPGAAGIGSSRERTPDRAAYLRTIRMIPDAVKWQIHLKGLANNRNVGAYRQYLERLTAEVNESIRAIGGEKLVEVPKLEPEIRAGKR